MARSKKVSSLLEKKRIISKEIEDEPAPTEQSGPKKEAPLSAEPAPEKSTNAPFFIQIPSDEMAWVAERKPFEAPRTVRAFIHDPNIIEATGLRGLKIDIRRPSSGPNYHTQVMTSDSASTASSGVFRLKVDGAEIASEAFGGIDRPKGFRDASVIEAMSAGETLIIEFGPANAPKSVSLPLAGFDEATCTAQNSFERTQAPVVVLLRGEELLAQREDADHLAAQ